MPKRAEQPTHVGFRVTTDLYRRVEKQSQRRFGTVNVSNYAREAVLRQLEADEAAERGEPPPGTHVAAAAAPAPIPDALRDEVAQIRRDLDGLREALVIALGIGGGAGSGGGQRKKPRS
jgi:hypothetical protein